MIKAQFVKSFSRRLSRSLRDGQTELMSNLLPKIGITESTDYSSLKDNYKKIILEIGSGNGEFIINLANNNKLNLYIAAETYINGIASLLRRIESLQIDNVMIYPDDVRLMLSSAPKNFFNKIYIICPDPWPKKRHFKRRLIQNNFLNNLAQHLNGDGTIEIATDHSQYAEWILNEIKKCGECSIKSDHLDDYNHLPSDWIYTKYQKLGISQGSKIYYFQVCKKYKI